MRVIVEIWVIITGMQQLYKTVINVSCREHTILSSIMWCNQTVRRL